MKKLVALTVVTAMLITTFFVPYASAAGEYVESFTSSQAFSTTGFAGPWYYYMQTRITTATTFTEQLNRMLGSSTKVVAKSITESILTDTETHNVKVGLSTDLAMPDYTSDVDTDYGCVGAKVMCPEGFYNLKGYTFQVMKAFESPYDCEAVISTNEGYLKGLCSKNNRAYGDRKVRIMKNNPSNDPGNVAANKIWPTDSDWVTINGIEQYDFSDINISLKKGDMLFFIVDNNDGDDSESTGDGKYNDDVLWDPVINVIQKSVLETPIRETFGTTSGGLVAYNSIVSSTYLNSYVDRSGNYVMTPNQTTYGGMYYGNSQFNECQMDFDVFNHSGGTLYVRVHSNMTSSSATVYYNILISNTGSVSIRKSSTTNITAVGNFGSGIYPNPKSTIPAELGSNAYLSNYHVTVYARDNLMRVYINNIMIASFVDNSPLTAGYIGFGAQGAANTAYIDNLFISGKILGTNITDFAFTDVNGVALTGDLSNYSASEINAKASLTNLFDYPRRYMLILAVYDSNGALVKCEMGDSTSNPTEVVWSDRIGRTDSPYNMSLKLDLSDVSQSQLQNGKVKCFIWDNVVNGGMTPRIESIQYPQTVE